MSAHLRNGKDHKIHRLVAKTFIPNPNNLPEVNHIDGNPKNNNVNNLEWCDRKTNLELSSVGFTRNKFKCYIEEVSSGKNIKGFETIISASNPILITSYLTWCDLFTPTDILSLFINPLSYACLIFPDLDIHSRLSTLLFFLLPSLWFTCGSLFGFVLIVFSTNMSKF